MDDGQPRGGKFSFDTENRLPWKGTPPAPAPPRYPVDEITAEVCALIERTFPDHPGELTPAALPASADDAAAAWRWALRHALPRFGPYEDAMSTRSSTLFHTQLAGLLNLHRLVPARVVADAAAAALPLASQEGFVRQILGWREFVRHVHLATDGFRTIAPVAAAPGDGGWSRWRGRAWPATAEAARELGGATPAALGAGRPLPVAYWGAPSGLACLDHVVADVWRTGYGHHITRLMILANLGALLDVAPRELTDWFWVAYADAYDWVVEPNVLGMGMFATGDLMTTKPYVAGAAYVDRMSDYCAGCRFDPKRSCPVTRLYWAFLDRHEAALGGNHRLTMPLAQLRKRAPAERARDRAVFDEVRAHLDGGLAVPADVVTRPR
jgi:deoxyribodipyrimidine photolyase-related protein